MEYTLTQEDIDNHFLADAVAGQVALPEELKVMGMTPPAGPASPALADPTAGGNPVYTDARNRGLGVAEAVMLQDPATRAGAAINSDPSIYTQNVSMPSAVSRMGGAGGASSSMLDLLSTPVPQDPTEGLSRNQRMLLGFAAMKDAGMALMGKDSNAVVSVMGDFTERANMERKRKAAVAQLEAQRQQRRALTGLFGGGSSDGGYTPDLSTPDGIRAHIARLTQYAASNPEAAAGVVPEIQRLQAEGERLEGAQQSLVSTGMGIAAVDALINSPDLDKVTGLKAFGNQWIEKFGAAPEYSNLMSYVDQIRGLNFLEAYQSLKGGGPITDIEGKQATAARTRIDRALKGTPRDLVAALEEVRALFDDARSKNPMYDPESAPKQDSGQPASGTPPTTFTPEEVDEYLGKG